MQCFEVLKNAFRRKLCLLYSFLTEYPKKYRFLFEESAIQTVVEPGNLPWKSSNWRTIFPQCRHSSRWHVDFPPFPDNGNWAWYDNGERSDYVNCKDGGWGPTVKPHQWSKVQHARNMSERINLIDYIERLGKSLSMHRKKVINPREHTKNKSHNIYII